MRRTGTYKLSAKPRSLLGSVLCFYVCKEPERSVFTFADNCLWDPEIRPNSLGLEFIDSLTGQVNGSFERDTSDNGTIYRFQFNKADLD
jgi:two-component sensor histidine kinase